MIDLDHPISQHVIAASRAEGAILIAARQMTVATRGERARLCESCASAFAELRRLFRDHFADRPAIPLAIDALERSLSELATLPDVPEQGPLADFTCPACGAAVEHRGNCWFSAPKSRSDIYCRTCLEMIMPSLEVLRSCEDGFGTDAI